MPDSRSRSTREPRGYSVSTFAVVTTLGGPRRIGVTLFCIIIVVGSVALCFLALHSLRQILECVVAHAHRCCPLHSPCSCCVDARARSKGMASLSNAQIIHTTGPEIALFIVCKRIYPRLASVSHNGSFFACKGAIMERRQLTHAFGAQSHLCARWRDDGPHI